MTDQAVAVPSTCILVKLCQCEESIFFAVSPRLRLRCEISKQLQPVVNTSVTISIERQKRIVRGGSGPGEFFPMTIAIQVKEDTVWAVSQIETISKYINKNW